MPVNLFELRRSIVLRVSRFKRVGPNAMRGRGIGTARGRATIMRGLPVFLNTLTHYTNSSKRMCSDFVSEANIDSGKRYDPALSVRCRYSISRHVNDFPRR